MSQNVLKKIKSDDKNSKEAKKLQNVLNQF